MQFTLKTYDGYDLYCQLDKADNARAVFILSHGFVEYGAHYSAFARYAASKGYAVLRYDERGHGRSSAPLGDLKAFQDYALDLDVCVSWVQDNLDLPVFTVGFSLGGMITLLYGLMYPYKAAGQIVMGSLSKPQHQFETLAVDSLTIHEFLDFMGTSGDRGIQQLVAMDSPYVLKNASKKFLVEALVKGPEFIREHALFYKGPILIMHGEKDPIVSVRHSQSLYDELGSDDKTLKVYEHQYHDMLRVKEYKEIVDAMISWSDEYI